MPYFGIQDEFERGGERGALKLSQKGGKKNYQGEKKLNLAGVLNEKAWNFRSLQLGWGGKRTHLGEKKKQSRHSEAEQNQRKGVKPGCNAPNTEVEMQRWRGGGLATPIPKKSGGLKKKKRENRALPHNLDKFQPSCITHDTASRGSRKKNLRKKPENQPHSKGKNHDIRRNARWGAGGGEEKNGTAQGGGNTGGTFSKFANALTDERESRATKGGNCKKSGVKSVPQKKKISWHGGGGARKDLCRELFGMSGGSI